MRLPVLDLLTPRWRKRVLWVAGLVLGYAILGFLILPPIIRAVAVRQLSQQLDREVSIQKVRLNPFVLSATVRGLLIRDKDGEPFVSWDEVYVNFQLRSFLGHPWVFAEVSATKPFVRAQMNKDYTLNFSDLIAKFSTNAPAAEPAKPSRPMALRIDTVKIIGAEASLTDLTPRAPFKRVVGPIDLTLTGFETDPENKNPYSFAGSTDAGEKFRWAGFFYLDPLRSEGELSVEDVSLNRYAALYQDLVRFQIKDGVVDLHATYRFELSASNRVAVVTNTSFALHSFKLAEPGSDANIAEIPEFSVTGASVDATARQAEIVSVAASGARLNLRRDKDNTINAVELSRPAPGAANAPGGILLLLHSITNAVALLLNSTNQWTAAIDGVHFENCGLGLEDLANSRPARLLLDDIDLSATNISNLPGTNLSASLSLRWNTNGTIKVGVQASFSPTSADLDLALHQLDLHPLDPYLEPKLDLFIVGSKLSLDGHVALRQTNAGLPQVTFHGDSRLDDFSTVDGVWAEDLLKWGSVRISGIDANLNPPAVAIREVDVDDAYARVIIETNRTINLLTALRVAQTNLPAPSGAEAKPAKKPRHAPAPAVASESPAPGTNAPGSTDLPKISIASVVISNAQIHFTDRSLKPNVDLSILQAGGSITGLSSEELHHADLKLHAMVDNVGPVEITGVINPLSRNQTNDIKIVVKNVDLTPTSPYVGKFAGYRLAQGKLNMDLEYHLAGRNIQAKNLIVLDRFTFGEKVNSPDATTLPVRLGVAILKDRDGKIELDVPVEGSLDNPDFKIHKVVVHAINNILTKVATSPFSLLGAVFGGKGEEISFLDFAPGRAALDPASMGKLDTLAKGLYARPALQLEIAGSVDPDADREGLRREALERKLRLQQWLSLRKSERANTNADQLILTPAERTHWLKKLYATALEKGEIKLPTGETNQPSAAPGQTAAGPLASLRVGELEKGATLLGEKQKPAVPPLPAPAPGPAKSKSAAIADALEQALLESITITDEDFRQLAAARAKAACDYLLQHGKVEGARVFLAEAASSAVKSLGSRDNLQLR